MSKYVMEVEDCFSKFKNFDVNPLLYIKKMIPEGRRVCVFGAGFVGICAVNILSEANIKIEFFCDNDEKKWDKIVYKGIKCISPEGLLKFSNNIHIIIATNKYKEILKQLSDKQYVDVIVDLNFNKYRDNCLYNAVNEQLEVYKTKINEVLSILEDDKSKQVLLTMIKRYCDESPFHCYYDDIYDGEEQYYPKDLIRLNEYESFVDCGAYIGDSMQVFFEKVEYNFSNFYAFELGSENYKQLVFRANKLIGNKINNVFLYNQGVWDKKESLDFIDNMEGTSSLASKISVGADTNQKVDSIDNVIKDRDVTFIKMDIEGAELKALYGAQQIIKRQKPKLAISIYHKVEDLWEIPLYIKSLYPEYKIYFRHHTLLDQDTVCYAIPAET